MEPGRFPPPFLPPLTTTPSSPSTSKPGPLDKLAWAARWLKGALETEGGKERRLGGREGEGQTGSWKQLSSTQVSCSGVKVPSSKEEKGKTEELVSETLFLDFKQC